MGTFVKITVVSADMGKAESAISEAFIEIERIEKLMSAFLETSQVYQLNENAEVEADEELKFVIKESIVYSDISEGAFDITVQPILDLYSYSFSELKRPPTDEEIEETLKLVNYNKINIDRNKITLQPGMKITLGGIAKGYAIDKAIESLENNGILNALVNVGGDMRAIGMKPGAELWRIALQNPRNKDDFITTIPFTNKAIATSGDYERYYSPDKKAHHIVNPKTGTSATELISVTIIAETALKADSLATSVFVLGKEKGLELIENLGGIEGLIITEDGEIIKSSGFTY